MSSQPHILALPRELRDMIYDDFLGIEEFRFDHEAGKLSRPDGTTIELVLRLTCTQIAAEMSERAFRNRTIVFKTVRSDILAGLFGEAVYWQQMAEAEILDELRDYITDEIQDELLYWFPQYRRLLNEFLRAEAESCWGFMGQRWGEAPSIQSAFIHHALYLIAKQPGLAGYPVSVQLQTANYELRLPWIGNGARLDNFIAPEYRSWTIPRMQDLDQFCVSDHSRKRLGYWDSSIYRFSAAAAASHFLTQVPREVRTQIRKITLIEDYPSVAHPQCHAQGLIEFCEENPELRIERRVSLWRTVFQGGHSREMRRGGGLRPLYPYFKPCESSLTELDSDEANASIASWLVEANVLAALGMPDGAFTLVLDGEPIPKKSSDVFRVVKLYAGDQMLRQQENNALHPLEAPPYQYQTVGERRFVCEDFPQMVEDIVSGASVVKCNFPTGESWCKGDTEEERAKSFRKVIREDITIEFKTEPPLPAWHELVLENLLPQ